MPNGNSDKIVSESTIDKSGSKTIVAAAFWSFLLDQYGSAAFIFITPFIAPQFYPSGNFFVSILVVYAAYGSQLIVKPIGAALWGVKADRIGRKRILVYSTLGISLLFAAIGAFPTYKQVGIVAPLLLELDSIGQGLITGALTASTHSMGFEHVREKYRGLLGGIVGSAAHASAIIGSVFFTFLALAVGAPAIAATWWRFYFGVGIIGVILPIMIHFKVKESALFVEVKEKGLAVTHPIRYLFAKANNLRKNFFQAFAAASLWGVFIAGYGPLIPTYVFTTTKIPHGDIGEIVLAVQAGSMCMTLVGGTISQKLGRRNTMILGSFLVFVYAYAFFSLGQVGSNLFSALGWAALIGVLQGVGGGSFIVFMAERFPTQVRGTGMSIS
ncbi:MAG: MFS transporter, partial [Nitrososphaerota archaeon]|nr:MFS transporter [Nitrososphaerota archaeon]